MAKKPVPSLLILVSRDPNPLSEALVCLGGTADAKQCGRGPKIHSVHFEGLTVEITHDPSVAPSPNPPTLTFIVGDEESTTAAVKELINSGIAFKKLGGTPTDTWEVSMPEATLRLERQEDALIDALKQETGVTTG